MQDSAPRDVSLQLIPEEAYPDNEDLHGAFVPEVDEELPDRLRRWLTAIDR